MQYSLKDLKKLSEISLREPIFEKGNANWINEINTVTKQYNIRKHSSTQLTPIQASSKKNEDYVYTNSSDKRKKSKSKYKLDLVRTADKKIISSKGNTRIWS